MSTKGPKEMPVMTKEQSQKGMSFIELAIAIMIIGLMAATAIQGYRMYEAQRVTKETQIKGLAVQKAMARFFSQNSRLPCPADPRLTADDVGAGQEQCTSTTACAMDDGTTGVCTIAGTDGQDILLGTVPYATIGVILKDSYDGWSRKTTYVVTKKMTDKATYDEVGGNIDVVAPSAGMTQTTIYDVPNSGSYYDALRSAGYVSGADTDRKKFKMLLLSHGSDGKGAYMPSGSLNTCFSSSIGRTRDSENCDMDFVFLVNEWNDPNKIVDSTTRRIISDASVFLRSLNLNSQRFYDDYALFYSLDTAIDYWKYDASETASIKNSGGGNVGVNPDLAITNQINNKLDLRGNVKAQNVTATMPNSFCDTTGVNCISSTMFMGEKATGGGLNCSKTGMNGIVAGPRCPAFVMPGVANKNCPAGEWAVGIDSSGVLKCSN